MSEGKPAKIPGALQELEQSIPAQSMVFFVSDFQDPLFEQDFSDLFQPVSKKFDFILDTVSVPHDLDALTALLKRDATLCLVGAPSQPHPSPAVFNLVFKRRQIAGSLIGGIRETQEMLDFCAVHGITSDIELIRMQDINTAYERMLKSDVKYRFVIDCTKF